MAGCAAAALYYPKHLIENFDVYPDVQFCFKQLTAIGCNITQQMSESLSVAEEEENSTGTAVTILSSAVIGALLIYGLFRVRNHAPAPGVVVQVPPPQPAPTEVVKAKQQPDMVCG